MVSSYPKLVLGFCEYDNVLTEERSCELKASLFLESSGIGGGRGGGEGLDFLLQMEAQHLYVHILLCKTNEYVVNSNKSGFIVSIWQEYN